MLEGRSVLVVDDRVEEVSESPISAPSARRIDVGGKTLMPGMIDAHVHCTAATMNLANMAYMPATLMAHEAGAILRGMLARGFTTIRDAAGADRGLAVAVDKGLVQGPRIYYAGRALSQTGGHGDLAPFTDDPGLCACSIRSTWMAHVADGVDAVRKAAPGGAATGRARHQDHGVGRRRLAHRPHHEHAVLDRRAARHRGGGCGVPHIRLRARLQPGGRHPRGRGGRAHYRARQPSSTTTPRGSWRNAARSSCPRLSRSTPSGSSALRWASPRSACARPTRCWTAGWPRLRPASGRA